MISNSIKLKGDLISTIESEHSVCLLGIPVDDSLKDQMKLLMEILESNEGRS